jgi:superfamily II DNA or RNA helicase
MSYKDFLKNKALTDIPSGFDIDDLVVDGAKNNLFDWQEDIVRWALAKGRASLLEDCGLGKTPQQLVWAYNVLRKKGDVLIVAPLAVSQQTHREGLKFGIEANYSRDGSKSSCGITITNYEMLHNFNPGDFEGIVLDESSILKSYTGKYRTQLIDEWSSIPHRLCCTATAAPNDLMELGNHAEFMGAMSRGEMLSMFFVHDGGETQKWRLKGHALQEYWKWVCSWAIMMRKPSDLGYDDKDFILPSLNMHEITVDVDHTKAVNNLFLMEAQTLQERQRARKSSLKERCERAAEIANSSDEPWLIWCDRNDESTMLKKLINDAVEVKGSDSISHKENSMLGFSDGSVKRLISKPSICGFGMNWQHCCKTIFTGLSDSYEKFYQSLRRVYRFGQKKEVDAYIITSVLEGAVLANIKRKEKQAQEMADGMVKNMHVYNEKNIKATTRDQTKYNPTIKMSLPSFMKG